MRAVKGQYYSRLGASCCFSCATDYLINSRDLLPPEVCDFHKVRIIAAVIASAAKLNDLQLFLHRFSSST